MAETFMELKNRSSISDTPLSEPANDFGTEQYVQGLVQFISNSAAPITIALQGEWGSGKTSLINRLYNDLCGDGKDFFGIKINTWEYSMLATPEETVVKIIAQLVREISASDPKSQNSTLRIFKSIANFSYRVGREALKIASPAAALAVEGMGVPTELGDGSKESQHVTLSDLREALNQSIKKKIGDAKKKEKKGIVVFVDDLNRLNPPVAVQILELLKNIFTLDNCIFVLAIDYDVVVKGLEPKFGKLEPSNEREFRSFFDKIIQVPFQLPVNNYQPMDFVLDSLKSIGYISNVEGNLPKVQSVIAKVVVSSAGKNPRSIKRLINTLSLNDCITRCCTKKANDPLEVRYINFAFVAMQVCYPKIYNILLANPVFKKWDKNVAAKLNLLNDLDKEEKEEIDGEVILDALCRKDTYLEKNQYNITTLLKVISENIPANIDDKEEYLRNILKRSASTNIDPTPEKVEFDRKTLMAALHENVWGYILKKKPELQGKPKRNTGNGGFNIYLPDESCFEVILSPDLTDDEDKIALSIWLKTQNVRPERLKGVSWEEVYEDEGVLEVLKPMNETVKKYRELGLIDGRSFEGGKKCDNIIDEFKLRREQLDWHELYSGDLEFWINLKSPSDFEEPIVVEAMGELILSAYELNCRALEFS